MDIEKEYQKPGAYKYGLKIASLHAEAFASYATRGAETIAVPKGEYVLLERVLGEHQLLVVRVGAHGRFEYRERATGAVAAKADIRIFLEGEGAEAHIIGRYDLSGATDLDLFHEIRHLASGTRSRIVTRGVLADAAHLIYRSAIGMEGELMGLDGEESGRFLVLSGDAVLDAIPALATGSKAVDARHALSVSRPPEEELFYMTSRGLSRPDARSLYVEGFLNTHV